MKILFLSAANSSHTVKWVNALAERGYEIHLVYNEGHNPDCDKINGKIKLHPLKHSGAKGYYLNAAELKKIEKSVQPDVINVHYASGYGTLARKSKIGPYLLSVWGSDVYEFPYKSFVNKIILKKNILNAQMLASTSHCMAQQLRKVLNLDDVEINITPFGIDLNHFECDEEYGEESEQIVLGTVKLLKPVYRIGDFVKAVAILKKQYGYDKLKAYIYGDGEQKKQLEELIEQHSLNDTVFLKGKIPNTQVPKALQKFDIFCAMSEKESFGVAVVEAMAMKVPVVVSDAEGFKEVVADGETGFIFPKGDVEEMAEKLHKLIEDKKLRKSMGIAGRKRVEELYDWNKNVDIMEQLYKQLEGWNR